MLRVDIQDQLAIILVSISSTVKDEEVINVRKWVIDLKVVDKRLAFGGLQKEDVKI